MRMRSRDKRLTGLTGYQPGSKFIERPYFKGIGWKMIKQDTKVLLWLLHTIMHTPHIQTYITHTLLFFSLKKLPGTFSSSIYSNICSKYLDSIFPLNKVQEMWLRYRSVLEHLPNMSWAWVPIPQKGIYLKEFKRSNSLQNT